MLLFKKSIKYFTYNTFKFNFYYFPLKTAIKFPVFVSSNVLLKKMKGQVVLQGNLKMGSIKIGYGDIAIFDKKNLEQFGL